MHKPFTVVSSKPKPKADLTTNELEVKYAFENGVFIGILIGGFFMFVLGFLFVATTRL